MRRHEEEVRAARPAKAGAAPAAPIPAHGPGRILALQRLAGNRAVQRLLTPPTAQRCGCGGGGGGCCPSSDDAQREVQGWWWDEEDTGADTGTGGTEQAQAAEEPAELGEAGGSWLDWATEQAGKVADWAEATWSEWTGGSDETDGGGPVAGELDEVAAATVECEAADTIGFGKGKGKKISLHGKTESNYNHGKPIPAPFPSTVTVTTGKIGKTDVFTAQGSFDVTFASNPAITLPSVPSGLRPCQQKAVQAFIDGPLTAHENDHANAFTSNYDGTFTATVNVKNIRDTPLFRKRAMENPVNAEDIKRANAANAASKALDPWKRTVTGLDCTD